MYLPKYCKLPANFYQIVASLSATLMIISDGMQYGWSSPMVPFLRSEESHIKISSTDETWLEVMFLVAGLVGLPLTAYLPDKIGRHKSILVASGTCLIAWIMIALTKLVVYLYIGRFMMGAASDLIFVTVPMYISEIADQKIRGLLTGLVYVMMWTGLIVIYSIGPFFPFYVPSIFGGGLLAFQAFVFWFMPESPYYLAAKGKETAARLALKKFKAKTEYEDIIIFVGKQKEQKTSFRDVIFKKSTIKAFAIVTLLNTALHFCGLSAILMNLHTILKEANSMFLEYNTTSIIFAALMLLATIFCSFFVDKFGRKAFLICSSLLTALCLFGLAFYFHLRSFGLQLDFASWLPVVCVMTYAVVFNLGLGVVPKIMASELFSNKVKAVGMTYGDAIYVLLGSLSIVFYKYMVKSYGMHSPFYIFGGVTVLVAAFTAVVIPETKGKSLEEIQIMLEN